MAQYKPVLDKKAAEAMNLTVLRRLDPAVDEVRIGCSLSLVMMC